MLKSALLLTTYNRPHYLQEVLESWRAVRGFFDWPLHVFLEPANELPKNLGLLEELHHPDLHVHLNPVRHGVLHNPWVGFEHLFRKEEFDFVVRIEDDLVVSDDILEYFTHQAELWQRSPWVYTVHGWTDQDGDDHSYELIPRFSPLIWGTWRDRWLRRIGPSWDHDYSTFNVRPGYQAGWDWNLNTRIFPADGALAVFPTSTRVKDIGEFGVHAQGYLTPDDGFKPHRPEAEFVEAEGREHDGTESRLGDRAGH